MDKSTPGSDHDKDKSQVSAAKSESHDSRGAVEDTGSSAHRQEQRGEGVMTNAMGTAERFSSGMVGGVTNVATDLVHGVGTIGGEVVNVVRDTANSAIAGVGSIGETAVHTVTGLLSDLVGGIRDIGSAAIHSRQADTMQRDQQVHRP